jgi:hypothetical protein
MALRAEKAIAVVRQTTLLMLGPNCIADQKNDTG